MIKVYYCNINDANLNIDNISKIRQEKISSLTNEKDKKLSLGCEKLFQQACKDLNINTIYSYNSNGKPIMDKYYISFSHSGFISMLCIADNNVGIDIELIRNIEYKTMSLRYFAKQENVSNLSEFFKLWTFKEAYGKYTGEGLNITINVDLNLIKCCHKILEIEDNYICTVVSDNNEDIDIIKTI